MENQIQQRTNRPPVARKVVLRLVDEDAPNIMVTVTATEHHPARSLPFYSIRIGRPINTNENPLPFFEVPVTGQRMGRADLDATIDRLYVMIEKAREFIQTDAAAKAMEYLDVQRERDEQNANRGKPVTRHTGKTERNRQKKNGVARP